MKLKERNVIISRIEILMKDNLISKEEFIRSKEDLDMARQSRESISGTSETGFYFLFDQHKQYGNQP